MTKANEPAFTPRQAAFLDAGGKLKEIDQLTDKLREDLKRDHNKGKHPDFDYSDCPHCARRLDPKPHSRAKREEGAVGVAISYMGDCPCGARIGFGDAYTVIDGKLWHYDCTVRGKPVTCRMCGRDFPPLGENRFPICEGLCWGAWQAFVWGIDKTISNLRWHFQPTPAKWR